MDTKKKRCNKYLKLGLKAGLHYSEVKWSEAQNFVTVYRHAREVECGVFPEAKKCLLSV